MKIDWESIFYWGIALFGLFVLYQIIRYLLGGSWELEELVVAILAINTSAIIGLIGKTYRSEGEFNEFKRSMLTLAKDFKEFREEMREFKHEMLHFKKETERDLGRLRHLMK